MQAKKKININMRDYGMFIALIFIIVLFQILTNGNMLLPMNISGLILQNSYLICISVGMFFCILTGNVDLAVGSSLGFCSAVGGWLIVHHGVNMWLGILLVLLVGLAIGSFQGFFIAKLKVPPFIATLAGMLVFQGGALCILQGHSISPFPPAFQFIASGYVLEDVEVGGMNLFALLFGLLFCALVIYSEWSQIRKDKKYGFEKINIGVSVVKVVLFCAGLLFITFKLANARGIPVVLLILSVIIAVYHFIASKTVLGRHVYALGGNAKAAALSGVKVDKMMFTVYANCGFMAALGGILVAARLNAASTTAGSGNELDAIASCYIGGCAAAGGEGKILGVVVGALVMGVLNNGMSMMGIGTDIQKIVKGLILLLAVTFDIYSKSKSSSN